MTRVPTLIAVLIFAMAALLQPVRPQTPRSYQVPREVKTEAFVRRTFPQYFNTGFPVPLLETDRFFPIGWSRDGKFAYYVEPVDEACGCYFAELRIQDLKTDAVLWRFKNDPENRLDRNGSPLDDDIRKLWRRNQKLFNEKLHRYKIEPLTRFSLLGPSFTVGGRNFTAAVSVKKADAEEYDEDLVTNVKVDLIEVSHGKKTVYSHKIEPGVPLLDVGVAGAFKSPFEDRAAIVIMTVGRGWEGPPHVVGINIAGADLRSGFKK